jgi:hypothetical protein
MLEPAVSNPLRKGTQASPIDSSISAASSNEGIAVVNQLLKEGRYIRWLERKM